MPTVVKHFNMKGQTLIEALIAFALIATVVTGITAIVTSSLGNARHSKDQNLAIQYAQEGVEVVRQIRNRNYSAFSTYNNTSNVYCLGAGATTLGSITSTCSEPNVPSTNSIFIRSVKIEAGACSANVSRVTVTVAWTDGRCDSGGYCHNSKLSSCLSTINPIQTP